MHVCAVWAWGKNLTSWGELWLRSASPSPPGEALLCSSSYILVGTESRNAEKRHHLSWCLEKQCGEWNEDEVVPIPLLTSHGALEPSFLICAEVVIMRA